MSRKRTNAPRSHASDFERVAVSPNTRFFELLWPGASSYAIAEALGGRISAPHVRMYRRGARPLPLWLRELARARMLAIAETLEAAPKGNGLAAGWNNLGAWRAARNSER